eukprot:SAG31_NODE_11344_length_1040_cov_1.720510_1_plen_76_part_00
MWAPIDALSAALTARFGFMVTINAHATPVGSKGFSAHTDHQDVLLLQLEGTKVTQLFCHDTLIPVIQYFKTQRAA